MRTVAFIAPFFADTTLRFVDAVAALPGIAVHLISQDPASKLPAATRSQLSGHVRVASGLDEDQLLGAVRSLQEQQGGVHRLLGALEQLQVPLGRIRERLGIEGMNAATASNFRDKARMKRVLLAAGVPCARHGLATTLDEMREAAGAIGYPLIVKPPDGAGAQGTHRIDGEEQLAECLRVIHPTPQQPVMLEEFIVGEEHSFDSVCIDGKLRWYSINRYYPTPLEVLREQWIQWCVLSPREIDGPEYADITAAAAAALAALGMDTGLSHLEWFRRPDGSVAISEVGARPPGAQFTTLISYACNFDLYAAWARLVVLGEFPAVGRPYAAGAAFLRGQGQGRVRAIAGIKEANRELGELVVESRLPQVGQPPSSSYEGDGYVIIRHPETETVTRALQRLVQLVRIELG